MLLCVPDFIKLGAGVYNWFKGEIIIFAISDALKMTGAH